MTENREKINKAIELGGICKGIAEFLSRACAELPNEKEKLIAIAVETAEELKEELE